MKKFWLVLFFVAAAQAGAATYVGSVDSGIASGWPLQNRFFASGQPTQVFATLNRTLQNPYTGETRGTVEYNVGYGEGHSGTTFTGTYIRQGNNVYFYFTGKLYPAARGARLVVDQSGTLCLSIVMSTSRRPVLLCEGPIGA